MLELSVIMVVGLLIGLVLLGALVVHLVLALVLFPLKFAFALLKGVAGAVMLVPVFAVGTAVFIGLAAVMLSLAVSAMLLHILF
jgi:hypothetical protein